MTNWNDLPREIQEHILRPVCHAIIDDFRNHKPDSSNAHCPTPLLEYHNLILSCKSVADIITNSLKFGYHRRSTARELRDEQFEQFGNYWRDCLCEEDKDAVIFEPSKGETYLQRLAVRVGKVWNSPEFVHDSYCDVAEMLDELPHNPKAQIISVLESWIREKTSGCEFLREKNYMSFSVRSSDQRFLFFTGRFELDLENYAISSIDKYSLAAHMWDPERLDFDECNLRMPGESFPLPENCESESDTWWCYRTRPRFRNDDPEWFIFSYKEGKLFSRHFRRVFGPGSVDDEQFKNTGRDQFNEIQRITY
jgi:hypothetical protein